MKFFFTICFCCVSLDVFAGLFRCDFKDRSENILALAREHMARAVQEKRDFDSLVLHKAQDVGLKGGGPFGVFEGLVRLNPGRIRVVPWLGLSMRIESDTLMYFCVQLDHRTASETQIVMYFLEGDWLDVDRREKLLWSRDSDIGFEAVRLEASLHTVPTYGLARVFRGLPILGRLFRSVHEAVDQFDSLTLGAFADLFVGTGVGKIVVRRDHLVAYHGVKFLNLVPLQETLTVKGTQILKFDKNILPAPLSSSEAERLERFIRR